MRKPKLFISHAWTYNDQYHRLVEMLNDRSYFDFKNHSVPEHDPLDFDTIEELEEKLRNKVEKCDVVIVLAGMYATYREWITKEIEMAVEYGKPIIAVKPWGQVNIPRIITDNADEIIGWNTDPIVAAIRRHI